jgi:glycosyltransferase involved in cell wall biosynthesis
VADHEIVVGHLARFHPQKDHRTLLDAASRCLREDPRLKFVLFGTDVTRANTALAQQADQLGISERCLFLGPNPAAHEALPGFDMLVSSSSFGEAFPLVVGEAMACEVPCVVTDVGDSPFLVGTTGRTVAPRDPAALSRALLELASLEPLERRRLGAAARARIEEHFSLSHVASLYTNVYESAASRAV